MSKIVIVGSLIVDVTGYCSRFPMKGETVLGSTLRLGPGGKGSNQATAAARQGAQVVMISKMGEDVFSQILSGHYAGEGMPVDYIVVEPEAETGSALIEVEEGGDNRIVVIKGANDLLTAAEVRRAEAEFASCDLFLTQLETSLESVGEGVRLAKKHGKPVILNPAPYQPLPVGLLENVDYITPNETEAESLTGLPVASRADAERCAERLWNMGVKNVVITLGAKGACLFDGHKHMHIPPPDCRPVDTTGAGDAFNGGLAVALAEGRPLPGAVRYANCVASISITRPGTSPAMPLRGESEALYCETYGGTDDG